MEKQIKLELFKAKMLEFQIDLAGMIAENQYRTANDQTIAYCEDSFQVFKREVSQSIEEFKNS